MKIESSKWSLRSIIKVFFGAILAVLALAIIVGIGSYAYRMTSQSMEHNQMVSEEAYFDNSLNYRKEDRGYSRSEADTASSIMPPYQPEFLTGSNAEEFEVRNYRGTIHTSNLDESCGKIAALKERKDVIFESSDKSQDSCYYRFKTKKEKDQEIVELIESFDPDYLNANVRSIQGGIQGVESELEILQKKLESIEETLESAQNAYDEITVLATEQNDTAALSSIINSKLDLIQRLSQERMYVKESIDRYNQNKSDQLDQLSYTFFDIHVQKVVALDWNRIKESWQNGVRTLVEAVNAALQGITLHLLTYLAIAAQVIIYLLLSAFLLKWVWRAIKWMWRGEFRGAGKR